MLSAATCCAQTRYHQLEHHCYDVMDVPARIRGTQCCEWGQTIRRVSTRESLQQRANVAEWQHSPVHVYSAGWGGEGGRADEVYLYSTLSVLECLGQVAADSPLDLGQSAGCQRRNYMCPVLYTAPTRDVGEKFVIVVCSAKPAKLEVSSEMPQVTRHPEMPNKLTDVEHNCVPWQCHVPGENLSTRHSMYHTTFQNFVSRGWRVPLHLLHQIWPHIVSGTRRGDIQSQQLQYGSETLLHSCSASLKPYSTVL